jgi:Flp pilus assembly protein TadB
MKRRKIMNLFIVFIIVLAVILVAVSLILDPLMGIFITCLVACLLLEMFKRDRKNKDSP